MYDCPICGQPGIPTWRRFMLGPISYTKCRACDGKVTVAWSSMFGMAPFIVFILAAPLLETLGAKIIAGVTAIGLGLLIWNKLARLVPK